MTDQPDLWHDYRRSDPATSKQAAKANRLRRPTQHFRTLEALKRHGPLPDYRIAELAGMLRGVAAKRRQECAAQGWISDTGVRCPTDTGAQAIVWKLTDAGMRQLRGWRADLGVTA